MEGKEWGGQAQNGGGRMEGRHRMEGKEWRAGMSLPLLTLA